MKKPPDIELTTQERQQLQALIVDCIVQANLNGIAVVFQRYGSPLPVMPATFGTWLHSGQPMLTSAVRSHAQFAIATSPHRRDQLAPIMLAITNLIPQGLDVMQSKDDIERPVSYDTCLLHLFTELLHELAHAATCGQVQTEHDNTVVHNMQDSEKQANEWEYRMYERLLDEELRKKVVKHRLFCHIFREGTEAKYNQTINQLLSMHFGQPETEENSLGNMKVVEVDDDNNLQNQE
jgi:hypothetical protein